MYIRKASRVYKGKTYFNYLLVESVVTPDELTCWKRWWSGPSRKLMVLLLWVMLAGLL